MSNPPKGAESAGNSQKKPEASDQGAVSDDGSKAAAKVHSDFPRIHRFWQRTKQVADFVGPTAFIIGVVFAIIAWIDFDISRRLTDETTLRKIAAYSRPSLIFNGKESIIADMGAVQYLHPKDASVKDIRITSRINGRIPHHIHIGFTRSLSVAPILTSLYDVSQITAGHGRGLDWEFELDWNPLPNGTNEADLLFRLEIVP